MLNNTDYFNVSNNYSAWSNNTTNETVSTNSSSGIMGISLVDIPAVRAVLITLYCLVFLMCFFGNLMLLIVVIAHPSMRTVTNFFLANLAAADFLVAIFCIIQRIVHQHVFFHGHWPLGELLCRLYIFLLQMVPSTSAGLLLVLSVERYVAVLKPMVAKRLLTKDRLALVAGLMWLISICANIPFLFSAKLLRFNDSVTTCTREVLIVNVKALVLVSFLLWYVAPLFCMIAIYTMIGKVLWQSTAEGAVAKTSMARVSMKSLKQRTVDNCSSADVTQRDPTYLQNDNANKKLLQVANTNNEPSSTTQKQEKVNGRRRVIRLLIAIIVSFALLCLPHHVRQLCIYWIPRYVHNIYGAKALLPDLAFLLLFLNSAINPVLYALMSKKFRHAIKEVFGQRKIRDKKRDQFVSSMRSTLPTTEAYSMTEC